MKKAGGYTAAIASLQRKRRKLDMIQEKIRSIIKEDFSQEVNAVDVRDGYLILSVPTVALDFRMRYLLPMLDAELRAQ
ncbi:MAG: hypothetical protein GY862_30500, partial [Gammaproteobacteria bacterium]|nr:hypothetical protein [Gammaproteobacteria bacterium]